jgi:hypothetical protein
MVILLAAALASIGIGAWRSPVTFDRTKTEAGRTRIGEHSADDGVHTGIANLIVRCPKRVKTAAMAMLVVRRLCPSITTKLLT